MTTFVCINKLLFCYSKEVCENPLFCQSLDHLFCAACVKSRSTCLECQAPLKLDNPTFTAGAEILSLVKSIRDDMDMTSTRKQKTKQPKVNKKADPSKEDKPPPIKPSASKDNTPRRVAAKATEQVPCFQCCPMHQQVTNYFILL